MELADSGGKKSVPFFAGYAGRGTGFHRISSSYLMGSFRTSGSSLS